MPTQNAWGLTRPNATDPVANLPAAINTLTSELAPGPAKTNVAFAAGWGNNAAPNEGVTYYRHLGRVWLQGLALRTGATASGTTLFTMPANCRPTGRLLLHPCADNGPIPCSVDPTTGVVVALGTVNNGFFLNFTGLSYRIS
jgi:hypothetical protein